jgi:hypothetical protein
MYNAGMSNEVIHISKAEAASNFASLLDRVRAVRERTAEMIALRISALFSRSLHGLRLTFFHPSDKSLGYFRSSASAG